MTVISIDVFFNVLNRGIICLVILSPSVEKNPRVQVRLTDSDMQMQRETDLLKFEHEIAQSNPVYQNIKSQTSGKYTSELKTSIVQHEIHRCKGHACNTSNCLLQYLLGSTLWYELATIALPRAITPCPRTQHEHKDTNPR